MEPSIVAALIVVGLYWIFGLFMSLMVLDIATKEDDIGGFIFAIVIFIFFAIILPSVTTDGDTGYNLWRTIFGG